VRVLKFISLALFFAGLAYGGYYVYQEFFNQKNKSGLHLISSDAVFVFESTRGDEFWERLSSAGFWDSMQEIPSVYEASRQVASLDSALQRYQPLGDILKDKVLTISLHPIGRNDFDFLFTLGVKNTDEKAFIKYLESNLPELSQVNERIYAGVTIKEFQSLNLDRNFSFTWIGEVLVGSFTSFLVEESIRNAQNSSVSNFRSIYAPLFEALPVSNGLGVLRLSSHGLARLIEGLAQNSGTELEQLFSKNMLMANYEVGFDSDALVLTGATLFPKNTESISQSPTSLAIDGFLSNRVANWTTYNLVNGQAINFFQNQGFVEKSTVQGDIDKKLLQNGFMDRLSGQFILLNFESILNNPQDKVLLVKTEGLTNQLALLKNINPVMGGFELSQAPVDFFGEQEIFVLSIEEFPAHIFGGKFLGFSDTYVTGREDYLIFANSSKAMKLFLDDLSTGNLRKQGGTHSADAFAQVYIDIPLSWSTLVEQSSPAWKPFFQKYARALQSFQTLDLRLGAGNTANFSTVIRLAYKNQPSKQVIKQDVFLTEHQSVGFPAQLIYGPHQILNFNDKSPEFVVQDENNVLYLVTSDMEQVFAKALDGPIVSEIFQVDYLKNGKLQMLFATANQVHILDRLGNYIQGFPVNPTSERIVNLNLVDYNNDRDYRYFLATEEESLWLLDRSGQALEGWNPKKITGEAVVKPAHYRIAGVGDRMIALSKKGDMYLFNRRGEAEIGSPLRLGESLHTSYALLERGNAKDTRLVTVTPGGEVVQVNFSGELTYRNQLEKEDKDTQFALINDQKFDRYIITSHSYSKLSVYDESYQLLFKKDIVSETLEIQYFSFGGDKSIVAVLDKDQEFLYLYSLSGELLNAMPISSSQKIRLIYAGGQNEYLIYTVSGNKLAEYRLPF
jgi:hypothetical protein